MLNSLPFGNCLRQIRKPQLLLSTLLVIGLCACSTPQVATGQATVAPQLPPQHPVLPRPEALDLRPFDVQIQPAVAGKPPLVTMTVPAYSSILQDLGDSAVRICKDAWLLDYYEGKNNGVKPDGLCQLPPLTVQPPTK